MKYIAPFVFIGFLLVVVYIATGVLQLNYLFGVLIPYASLLLFLGGFIYRVYTWASAPVPYRVPTTAGQARSLSWIKRDRFETPHTLFEVLVRMAMEVLLFRSLFRNNKAELRAGPNLSYTSSKWLWLGSMVFHWALLIIVLRHYRFFLDPVPGFVGVLEYFDGLLQVTLPTLFLTDVLIVASVGYLLARRIADTATRYISLPQDYFPLYLIGGIAVTGILLRYLLKTDLEKIKLLTQSLIYFKPMAQEGISPLFYMHLFLVCTLGAYFPFSKLMHMGGVFFSPTRNLANNNREKRHINPVNPEIKLSSYAEYEDRFRDKMKAAGLPVDKE